MSDADGKRDLSEGLLIDRRRPVPHGIPKDPWSEELMTSTPRGFRAGTVDEYISGFGEMERSRLAKLREVIRTAAPTAVEGLKWRTPAFSHPEGVILVMLSGHKSHANVVFTPSTKEAFAAELRGMATGKGSVKIPYADPSPESLIDCMVRHRVREFEDDGILWM